MTGRGRCSVRLSPESSQSRSGPTGRVRSHRTGGSQRPMNYCAENPRLADLTLNKNLSASGHSTEPESDHLGNFAHAWPEYRMHPVTSGTLSLSQIPDASGIHVRRVRSPRDQRIQLLFLTNFLSFANVPTPPSVQHLVHVC